MNRDTSRILIVLHNDLSVQGKIVVHEVFFFFLPRYLA